MLGHGEIISPFQAQQKNPLALAFLGDTVWELLIRSELLTSTAKAGVLHKQAVALANAKAQATASQVIYPQLTQEEQDIFRRAENAQAKHSPPKNQSPVDYHRATGLEAIFGYLYLTGQNERLFTLFTLATREA